MSLYKVAKFFMIPAGIWRVPISERPYIQKIYLIYCFIIQTQYILYNISMLIRLKEMLEEVSMDQIYTDITLAILISEFNYKVIMYLKNKIPQMFFTVIQREEDILKNEDPEITAIYLDQIKYYKIATFCQCFCSGFAISIFVVLNLYQKLVVGMLPDENFMYQLWFPFDKKKHVMFVTLYNIFIAGWGFIFNCSIQTPLQTLLVFSTSQLRILQLKLRKFFSTLNEDEKQSEEDLKDLIKEHQFLIE